MRVREDDPAIAASDVRLEGAGFGESIRGYAARPREARADTPGIVVVHHLWGVDTQIRDVVRRFAKEGFIAIAPALYSRFDAPSGDGATDNTPFLPIAQQMADQRAYAGDITAAREWLRAQSPNGKVGILGFCLGGTLVFEQLIDSHDFDAAVVFYGDPNAGAGARITTPVLGIFGELDTIIAIQDAQTLFAEIPAPHDLRIYANAGHAFFDDTRARYVPDAADDAWQRTLAWFEERLKSRRFAAP